MNHFRPEALATLSRLREAGVALLLLAVGLWIATRGGWLLAAFGLALAGLGAGLGLLALRRLRFRQDPGAPGIVELDEGRVRYLHPRAPGEVSLADLAELRLVTFRGRRMWRLEDLAGARLLIPVDAAGTDQLFDALSLLPGLSSADLVAALAAEPPVASENNVIVLARPEERRVWRRSGRGLMRSGE